MLWFGENLGVCVVVVIGIKGKSIIMVLFVYLVCLLGVCIVLVGNIGLLLFEL